MQYKQLQHSQWQQQNPFRRLGDIREFLKMDFYCEMHIFQTIGFSSFIECAILWDVNAKQLIQFEG